MPSGTSPVFQSNEFTKAVSDITGRVLFINGSDDQFLIPPTFDAGRAREAALGFDAFWRSPALSSVPTPDLRPYLSNFHSVTDIAQFGQALTLLIRQGSLVPGNTNKGRICDLLVALWGAGCLVFPREAGVFVGRLHGGRVFWGETGALAQAQELLRQFTDIEKVDKVTVRLHLRMLVTVMVSTGGVRESGDLTPEVIDGRVAGIKVAPSFCSTLTAVMRLQHGEDAVRFSTNDYGPFGRKSVRSDDSFAWAVEAHPDLEEWRALCSEWIRTLVRDVKGARAGINAFLEYLIRSRGVPRTPRDFLSTSTVIDPPLETEITYQRWLKIVAKFLDWVISTRFVFPDDNGHPYVLPGFKNPVSSKMESEGHRSETVRDAMPTRFVRRLREIIEEDDFAWPRTAFGRGVDTIRWFDPEARAWTTVWSPVRALAILMKLELPERTFQIRVCNSGEADPERFDMASSDWVPNTHPLAGQTPYGHPMGLARKIDDQRTKRTFTGLYFNTNKTGDIGKPATDRGHVIPWQNERVLQIADTMRRWQERFNPIVKPTPWTELTEDAIASRYSETVLKSRGAETFLFRDPCSSCPDQPVLHSRLTLFWNKACGELERRLSEEGETGPNGNPIILTLRTEDGRITGTVYNLHALRVTMITAYAEAGVPADIVMKITGHASIVMVIYYQKQTVAHVTDILNAASLQTAQNEQADWLRWLRSKSYEELKPLVAWNDVAGLRAFAEGSGSSFVRREHGICPVGCALCHVGGARVDGAANQAAYHPVQGGSQNCVRCRFFLSGPEFMGGLAAHYLDIGFRLREASKAYVKANSDFERLDHERKVAVAKGEPFMRLAELDVSASTLDQRTREVDELALSWHAAYNLLEQCKAIANNPQLKGDSTKSAVIHVGSRADLEFVIELDERNEREFELLDQLCQNAVFFPLINPAVPNIKRMRRFDAFLSRNGYDPVFISMTEEDALNIGNEFARFLFRSFGQTQTNRLMNGDDTLKALGIRAERSVVDHLASIVGQSVERKGAVRLIEHRAAS